MVFNVATFAVLAAFTSFAHAFTFKAPYKQNEWVIVGDAKITDHGLVLAGLPGESGSVWTREMVQYPEWTLEAVLQRLQPPDAPADPLDAPGDNGFVLWYTARPNSKGPVLGGSDQWDGLAVFMDTRDPNGEGEVRGHLNDGSYRFLQSTNVQSDALSLCRVPFKRASGPITLRIGFSAQGFAVDVNGQRCFRSLDVSLPPGYFGVSAGSGRSTEKLLLKEATVRAGMDAGLVSLLDPNPGQGQGQVAIEQPQQNQQQQPPQLQQQQPPQEQQQQQQQGDSAQLEQERAKLLADLEALLTTPTAQIGSIEERLQSLSSRMTQLMDGVVQSLKLVDDNQQQLSAESARRAAESIALQREINDGLLTYLQQNQQMIEQTHKAALVNTETIQKMQLAQTPTSVPSLAKIALVVLLIQLGAVFLTRLLRPDSRDHQKLL